MLEGRSSRQSEYKYLGEQPVLCVRVAFSNEPLQYGNADWNNLLFGSGEKTLRSYYDEVSKPNPNANGKIEIVPATGGATPGVVNITINQSSPAVPNYAAIQNVIIQNVLPALRVQNLVDFSAFDKNNDGHISPDELHLLFVFAGTNWSNESQTEKIRGHHTWFPHDEYINGKILSSYSVVAEQNVEGDGLCNLGTICHEIGHDLGLPDLYDTAPEQSSFPNSQGIGDFGLMGGGSWTHKDGEEDGSSPTHLCAYSKIRLGIVQPVVYQTGTEQNFTLRSFSHNTGYNVVQIPTQNSNEYFLIENRQPQGFDAGLDEWRSGGIAIWHINTLYADEGNICYGKRLVDIEEADEFERNGSSLDTGKYRRGIGSLYCWYGMPGNGSAFNPYTMPSTQLYSGNTAPFYLLVNSDSDLAMEVNISNRLNKGGAYRRTGGKYIITSEQGYTMAMQQNNQGQISFQSFSREEEPCSESLWFIESDRENRYSLISPFAYPNSYLSFNGNVYLDSSGSVTDAQKWRFFEIQDNLYIQSYDGNHILNIGSVLGISDNHLNCELQLTFVNDPIPADITFPVNMRLSDSSGDLFLDVNSNGSQPVIEKVDEAEAQIWYCTLVENSSSFVRISLSDFPDRFLTYNSDGLVTLENKQLYLDNQKWVICDVNGHIQIRPKSDLSKAFYVNDKSASQDLHVNTITFNEHAYFQWELTEAPSVNEFGKFYFAYRADNGDRRVLDAENFGLESGTIVQGFSFNGASNQRWIVSNISGDAYIIYPEYNPELLLTMETGSQWVTLRKSADSQSGGYIYNWRIETEGRTCRISPYSNPDKCLRLDGGGRALVMPPAGDDYEWLATEVLVEDKLNTLPEGTYRLKNVKSSYYLHGYGSINGHAVYQYDGAYNNWNQQVWSWEKVEDSAGSANDYYILRSLYDPKVCLTYDESIGRCVLIPYTGGDNQKWRSIREVEDGTYGPYRFMLKSMPGHVMVVEGATTVLYEDIVIFGDNGTANGHWIAESTKPVQTIADGNYLFTNKNSGLVMDAENFKTDEGTRVLQWSSNSGENQLWIVKRETDGYYRISPSYAPNMYFSVGSDEKIRLTYDKDADEAKWLFLDGISYPSYYRLTPKSHPGMVAVVQYASKDEGAELILYADNGSSNGYWAPVEQPLQLTGNMYRIQNAATGLYLGAESSNGAAIGVGATGGYSFDIWAVWSGGGFYRLSPYKYGSHLAVAADGRTVTLDSSAVSDPDAELWYFTQDGCIHSKKYPGKVLVLQDDASAVGTPVILAEQHTMDTETWIANAIG